MLKSIIDDVKQQFSYGNMVTKLIIINVAVFVIAVLLIAFDKLLPFSFYISSYFALNALPSVFIFKPWTFFTNMFLHTGFIHILMNMIGLNLFGRIVGDLIGDRKILPLYLFGGLFASFIFIISFYLDVNVGNPANGASGAIMAIAMTAAIIAPDYIVRLLLIGDVKLKFIVFTFILLDIIGSQGVDNAGGHYAHLGGLLAGFLYISYYKRGVNLLRPFEFIIDLVSTKNYKPFSSPSRPKMKVEHRSDKFVENKKTAKNQKYGQDNMSHQEHLDYILDKIKDKGYDKLSSEEKDFLRDASKKD